MADQERILPGRGPIVKNTRRVPAGGATALGYEIILRRE